MLHLVNVTIPSAGHSFDVVLKFWLNGPRPSQKRMYLLDGCNQLVSDLSLQAGDTLLLYRSENDDMYALEVERKKVVDMASGPETTPGNVGDQD